MKKRNKKDFIILSLLILIIIMGIALKVQSMSAPRDLQVKGNELLAHFGKTAIDAELGAVDRNSFILDNGYASKKAHGILIVTSAAKAQELAQYEHDYGECDILSNIVRHGQYTSIVLYGKDQEVQRKIKMLVDCPSWRKPVVEITGRRLKIKEYTYRKKPFASSNRSDLEKMYLVEDIKILQGSCKRTYLDAIEEFCGRE